MKENQPLLIDKYHINESRRIFVGHPGRDDFQAIKRLGCPGTHTPRGETRSSTVKKALSIVSTIVA